VTSAPCPICGAEVIVRRVNQTTCGSEACKAANRKRADDEQARRRRERADLVRRGGGEFLAIERRERLAALRELVKWADVQEQAEARRERALVNSAARRMREVVSVLGFDPLTYLPERSVADAMEGDDGLAVILSRRLEAIIRALPGTTNDLADAAGIPARYVSQYVLPLYERGEITRTTAGRRTWWAVAE
jgi:hypothetical protein